MISIIVNSKVQRIKILTSEFHKYKRNNLKNLSNFLNLTNYENAY